MQAGEVKWSSFIMLFFYDKGSHFDGFPGILDELQLVGGSGHIILQVGPILFI